VVFTASQVHPVFLGQGAVADRVLAAAYVDSASMRAPWLSLPEPLPCGTASSNGMSMPSRPTCRRTGKIAGDRVDSIALVAVREAYHRRIPPALVLGVMLTEKRRFKSKARSKRRRARPDADHAAPWTPNLGAFLSAEI